MGQVGRSHRSRLVKNSNFLLSACDSSVSGLFRRHVSSSAFVWHRSRKKHRARVRLGFQSPKHTPPAVGPRRRLARSPPLVRGGGRTDGCPPRRSPHTGARRTSPHRGQRRRRWRLTSRRARPSRARVAPRTRRVDWRVASFPLAWWHRPRRDRARLPARRRRPTTSPRCGTRAPTCCAHTWST